MFLVRWIRKLVSLPPTWLGFALAMLKQPGPAHALLAVGWHISGDERLAVLALSQLISTHGLPGAYAKAQVWALRNPGPGLTAFAGLLALDLPDVDSAREWMSRLGLDDSDREGWCDMLRFRIRSDSANPSELRRMTEELADRHDLSPGLCRLLSGQRIFLAALDGEYEVADELAWRVLEIDADEDALMARWALAPRLGGLGEPYLAAARQWLEQRANLLVAPVEDILLGQQATWSFVAGDRAACESYLAELRQRNPSHAERVATTVHSLRSEVRS